MAETHIEKLLAAFSQNPSDDYVATMLEAAEGFPDEIVAETCNRFISGNVDGFDPRFLPSVPQWASEARRLDALKQARERHEANEGQANVISFPKGETAFLRKFRAMKEANE